VILLVWVPFLLALILSAPIQQALIQAAFVPPNPSIP